MIKNIFFAKNNKIIQGAVADDTDLELLEAIKDQFGADEIVLDEVGLAYELIDGVWTPPPSVEVVEIDPL